MHNSLDIVQISHSCADLSQNVPNYFFFDLVLLFGLAEDEVTKTFTIEILHHYVDILCVVEVLVDLDDVGVVERAE